MPSPRTATSRSANEAADLIQASADNHAAWFAANSLASGGGEVRETNGVRWTITPDEAIIAFPRLSPRNAGETLDTIVAECFRRKIAKASCWSLSPTRPRDLGARIAARGFEWGWRPHWMALDLRGGCSGGAAGETPATAAAAVPEGVTIAVEDTFADTVDDLPYYNPGDTARLETLAQQSPRRFWRFVARLNGAVVGQSALYVTESAGGIVVGGIYNVGVVPSARHQGIGKAVSWAACRFAAEKGCRYALLNSAADTLYEKIGFVSLGWGQTWWMHAPTLAGPPPTPAQIAFAEAIGKGDTAALDSLAPLSLPADWDAPLASGMTPMALAVRGRRVAAAEWLASRGATLDILDAWDLGDKPRARRLIIEQPELVNRLRGNWQTTPLHEAASRGDTALARLLLTHGRPNLEIQDREFNGTPLGWAKHLERTEIVALIERYQASQK